MKIRGLIFLILLSSLLAVSGCQKDLKLLPTFKRSIQNHSYFQKRNAVNRFQVFNSIEGQYWKKMERIRIDTQVEPKMHELGRHRDQSIVNCFGTPYPETTDFCLHQAGAPEHLTYKTPVLLIHGANTNATRSWADPEGDGSKTGLMQYLKAQGYQVFAVTFANKHGDNYIWVKHIQAAIERIKQLTGSEQVDALGHSKGGFALRLYVSNLGAAFDGSIRKAIFVGTPHRGLDYTFRHSIVHWGLMEKKDNPVLYAPLAWNKILWKGRWVNTDAWSFGGSYFPGQAQMLARWDKIYPLPTNEPDWMTTYYGGRGFVSRSSGIKKAIQKGGNLIEKLKNSSVDSRVQIANLVGTSPTIPGILNEMTGPSDGIVFVKSARAISDLTAGGAHLLADKTLNLHHLDLISSPRAMEWVEAQLRN